MTTCTTDEMRRALEEIEELCYHWELHDKTDPDEQERWRLAAIRRAEMIGDRARRALAAAGPAPEEGE